MAELTTEALNRMIGISATDVAAGHGEAECIAKEQSEQQAQAEAVDKLAMQAEQAIQNIPSTYPGRSSLISDIQGAIASARASARSGGTIDLAGLRQLIAKAEETGKENTNRQASQNYLDASIAYAPMSAEERIKIRTQYIDETNIELFANSFLPEDSLLTLEQRKTAVQSAAKAMLETPEGRAIIEQHNNTPHAVKMAAEISQNEREHTIKHMLESPEFEHYHKSLAYVQRTGFDQSAALIPYIERIAAGEQPSRKEFWAAIRNEEARVAVMAEPYQQTIIANHDAWVREALGSQLSTAEGREAIMKTARAFTHDDMARIADVLAAAEKGDLSGIAPEDIQKAAAYVHNETIMINISMHFMVEREQLVERLLERQKNNEPLEQWELDQIRLVQTINNNASDKEARIDALMEIYSEHPSIKGKDPAQVRQYMASALNQADGKGTTIAGLSDLSAEERVKFSKEIQGAFTADVLLKSFGKGVDAMLAGDAKATELAAQEAASNVAKAVEASGADAATVQVVKETTETVLSGLGTAAVTVSNFFSSGPQFNAEIQQQLAGLDLTLLKDAQGNALAIKDADGKVDMGKVAEALKERGISLKDVDVDTNGDITGQELLTALSKQKQTDQPQIS